MYGGYSNLKFLTDTGCLILSILGSIRLPLETLLDVPSINNSSTRYTGAAYNSKVVTNLSPHYRASTVIISLYTGLLSGPM